MSSLGQIGEIKRSPAVVMRVKTGKPVPYAQLRWRGIALSTFDGKRWSTPNHRPAAIAPDATGWIYVADPEQNLGAPAMELHYEILVQPMATDAVFVPANAVSILGGFSGENPTAGFNARRTYLFRDFTGSIFNPFRNYAPVRYYGYSRLPALNPAKLRAASTEYPAEIRDVYLQLPPMDARIAALAKGVAAKARTPYDKAVATENYLRTRFTYTLELTGKPGDEPLAHFLFETHAGHCEYFASAMTIMLRTLGIPAREVNGFLPGEFNDLAGDYIVRASDAHSWVEAYFPGSGWVTFDPTPAADENFGFLSRLGLYVDWMELTWNEWVINYDFAHQVQMAQIMQRNTRNWTEAARSWFTQKETSGKQWLRSWLDRRGGITFAMPVAIALLLVLLRYDVLRALVQKLRLVLAASHAGREPRESPAGFTALCGVVEDTGAARVRADGIHRRRWSLRWPSAKPGLAPVVREFTQIYTHARFGGAPCDTLRLRGLLEQVRASQAVAQTSVCVSPSRLGFKIHLSSGQ